MFFGYCTLSWLIFSNESQSLLSLGSFPDWPSLTFWGVAEIACSYRLQWLLLPVKASESSFGNSCSSLLIHNFSKKDLKFLAKYALPFLFGCNRLTPRHVMSRLLLSIVSRPSFLQNSFSSTFKAMTFSFLPPPLSCITGSEMTNFVAGASFLTYPAICL